MVDLAQRVAGLAIDDALERLLRTLDIAERDLRATEEDADVGGGPDLQERDIELGELLLDRCVIADPPRVARDRDRGRRELGVVAAALAARLRLGI